MTFALTKPLQKERDALLDKLRGAATDVQTAISDMNEAMADHKTSVEEAQEVYNELLGELQAFRDARVEEWRGEYDEKSEKWQEGERAETVSSWIEEYEGIDLEDINIDLPDDVDEPDMDHADSFAELQESASEV